MHIDQEKRKSYMRSLYKKKRDILIELLGGKCSSCGNTYNLEFDHKDREDKKFVISSFLNKSWEETLLELKKCQLLCSDCHKKKTQEERRLDNAYLRGSKIGTSKLKEEDIPKIREKIKVQSMRSVAKEFGVNEKLIRLIKSNEIWKHVS